jgi:hypothetical protein
MHAPRGTRCTQRAPKLRVREREGSLREELEETLTVIRLNLLENLCAVLDQTDREPLSRMHEGARWIKRRRAVRWSRNGAQPACSKPSRRVAGFARTTEAASRSARASRPRSPGWEPGKSRFE